MKNYLLFLLFVFVFFTEANAQYYTNVTSYSLSGAPTNGIKIKTNLPFTFGSQMPTIIIQGYNYGSSQAIDLQINYFIANSGGSAVFNNATVASFGAYTPTIILANESSKVVIYINDKPTSPRFTVSAFAKGFSADSSANYTSGWSVADETLTGTSQVTVSYKNGFAGTVTMPGTGIWNTTAVGIGTTSPASTLQVKGDARFGTGSTYTDLRLFTDAAFSSYYQTNSLTPVTIPGSGTATAVLRLKTATSGGTTRMDLVVDGNVGIGVTTIPTDKLDVNGTIHAKQVNIDLTGWSDYVFKNTYHLPTLAETETYINQYHHLSGIPSEQQMVNNGLNVGEMNTTLVKKVEELTLYVIALNKQLEKQQKEISRLKHKNHKRISSKSGKI